MMKASLVWSSPNPERTMAVAMRRCYSTKVIEDIELELEQKGVEYWKYLLEKCLEDKSLDVFEHFALTFVVEEIDEAEVGRLVRSFPYVRISELGAGLWLVSMNARTLVELWRDPRTKVFAHSLVSELDLKQTCPMFSRLVFGEKTDAR